MQHPDQLRWFLLENLTRLQDVESIYQSFLIAIFATFLVLALARPLANRMPPIGRALVSQKSIFVLSLIVFIGWARFPGLLAGLLNPDEGLFTAAAMKLLRDPFFWRSVDTGSSGPVNIFPLTIPAMFGWSPDFASSRLIGLMLITGAIVLLYGSLTILYSDGVARLAMLPVATTVALMTHKDFVAYTSEHGPVFLLSLAFFLLCRFHAAEGRVSARLPLLFGFVVGLMPYTKAQGIPIAMALAAIFLHIIWRKSVVDRRLLRGYAGWLVIGGLLPTLVVIAYLLASSLVGVFWEVYVQSNLYYVDMKPSTPLQKLKYVWWMLARVNDLNALLNAVQLTLYAVPVLLLARLLYRKANIQSTTFAFIPYSLVILLASLFAVSRTGNSFEHYLLFLVFPAGVLIGVVLGEYGRLPKDQGSSLLWVRRLGMGAFVVVLAGTSVSLVHGRVGMPNPYLSERSYLLSNYRSAVADAITKIVSPTGLIEVWGWTPALYVETGHVQATRYGMATWLIEKWPLQDRFLAQYVEDINASKPDVFVDAIAPGMFYSPSKPDRATHGHDAFPQIAAIVRDDYDLIDEIRGVRIYKRKPGK